MLSTYVVYMCATCGVSMSGPNAIYEHMSSDNGHADDNSIPTYSLEFDWVLLIPGPGPVEMNLLMIIVEFTWDIFWRQIVITLNLQI